jgi:hypothetical protein
MFGRFFDTTEVDRFADWIVSEFKRQLPPIRNPPVRNVGDRANKLDQVIANRTQEFLKTAKLNFYKKAHLVSRVREGMTATGYSETFVKSISYDLLNRLQKAKR